MSSISTLFKAFKASKMALSAGCGVGKVVRLLPLLDKYRPKGPFLLKLATYFCFSGQFTTWVALRQE